jgi:protease I
MRNFNSNLLAVPQKLETAMTHPTDLKGLKVAILVTDGFEQVELVEPRKALDQAGATTSIVSPDSIIHMITPNSSVVPKSGNVRGWKLTEWGDEFPFDVPLDRAQPSEYDALLLPGGMINPDILRLNSNAVSFVKAFFDAAKPVAAICHGPWTVIDAGGARGRRMTSWPSLKTDLRNAGADWMDQEVVVDGNLVSSRKPDDIPAFNREILKLLREVRERNGATT